MFFERLCSVTVLGPDLQNILRQSYDNVKVRSTYDGRLIYKTSYEERKVFLRYTIHLQYRKIAGDSARKLACDIPERNPSTSEVTIVSPSYDKLEIIL